MFQKKRLNEGPEDMLNYGWTDKYDLRPERLMQYAKLPTSTAKPSVMVNGQIYWGVGRYLAALIRGDKQLKVWNVTSH